MDATHIQIRKGCCRRGGETQYANRRQVLARLDSRSACLRLRRFTSLRQREAVTEVGRSWREGIVMVAVEYERPW